MFDWFQQNISGNHFLPVKAKEVSVFENKLQRVQSLIKPLLEMKTIMVWFLCMLQAIV